MDVSPEEVLQLVRSGKAPEDLKGSLARGIFPLGPADMLEVLVILSADENEAIRSAAARSLKRVPKSLVLGVCSSPASPSSLLDRLARFFSGNSELLEKIILNPSAPDRAFAFVASLDNPGLLEIIGRNQRRLEQAPMILASLKSNPATPPAVLQLWEESAARSQGDRARRLMEIEEQAEGEKEPESNLPDNLVEEDESPPSVTAGEGARRAEEMKKQTIIQILKEMSAGHKVALAIKGNSEVRKILVRDKNRLINTKVLENPRITESEIESYAKSTNVSEDVLRTIGNTREWVRQPVVVRALVNNPKTPLGLSMGLLKMIPQREMGNLSKNRNIPEALRNTARKWYQQRKGSKR